MTSFLAILLLPFGLVVLGVVTPPFLPGTGKGRETAMRRHKASNQNVVRLQSYVICHFAPTHEFPIISRSGNFWMILWFLGYDFRIL